MSDGTANIAINQYSFLRLLLIIAHFDGQVSIIFKTPFLQIPSLLFRRKPDKFPFGLAGRSLQASSVGSYFMQL